MAGRYAKSTQLISERQFLMCVWGLVGEHRSRERLGRLPCPGSGREGERGESNPTACKWMRCEDFKGM